jgi:hypothetical protein
VCSSDLPCKDEYRRGLINEDNGALLLKNGVTQYTSGNLLGTIGTLKVYPIT